MHTTRLKTAVVAVRQATAFSLRPYQADVESRIYSAWNQGARNVMAVLPTGAGKTVLFAKVLADHAGACCAIAHRQELVAQISTALARNHVRHRIIGPTPLIKYIVREHMRETGSSYYDASGSVAVAGVDTLIRRADKLAQWLQTVTLWVQDEGHHILAGNKWGLAAARMPNARGLAVTATPDRADGKGLGREADGIIDALVVGPDQRWMIDQGYLVDYRIFAPPSDMKVDPSMVSAATGDYSQKKLAAAAKASHIVGDVVKHYQRHAAGKRGVTFYPDVETATAGAKQFNQAGVPAEAVSAKTQADIRSRAIQRLRDGDLLQLTNVDIFGEGFDLPAIDVVSMARPTESFSLFCQQVGRALRPVYAPGFDLSTREGRLAAIAASPKPHAIILDHVGNVARHGVARELADGRVVIDLCYREWSLEGRDKKGKGRPSDAEALTTCLNPDCLQPYLAVQPRCPYCGFKPVPVSTAAPEFVDGDLTELDPLALGEIIRERDRIDAAPQYPANASPVVRVAINKRHTERQKAQAELRDAISWWAAWQKQAGREDAESYRRFWHAFGIDIATAQTLGAREARELAEKVTAKLAEFYEYGEHSHMGN